MPVYSDLAGKTEAAAKAWVQALDPEPANIYTGQGEEDKLPPAVIISATSGREEPPFTGNHWVTLEVMIRSKAIDGVNAHRALVAQVFDAFKVDDLPEQLSALQDDFTVMGTDGTELSHIETGDCFEDTLRLPLYAAPSDL